MTIEELKQRRYDKSMGDEYYWVWHILRGQLLDAKVVELDHGFVYVTGSEVDITTHQDYFGWIKIEPPEVT